MLTGKQAGRQAKDRLNRNLSHLESFCHAAGNWPPQWLLKEIKDDVIALDGLRHAKRPWPDWEAFVRVHERNKKLQLCLRVDDLIKRALAILPRGFRREFILSDKVFAALRGNKKAQRSLRDKVLKAENPGQVFWEYRQMIQEECKAEPLVSWIGEIRHWMAKDFGFPIRPTDEQMKAEDRRERELVATRHRKRRERLHKKSSKKFVRKARHLADESSRETTFE